MADDSKTSGRAPQSRRMVIYRNPEKLTHGAGSTDPFVPSTPTRMLFVGPPGCGKRSALLNVLASFDQRPSRIIVIHGAAGDGTTEYRGITKEVRPPEDIPSFDELVGKAGEDRDDHKVVIVDEIAWGNLSKPVMSEFERLMNHRSTHANTSLLVCSQQMTSIPAKIRRGFQHYVIFKSVDLREVSDLALRVGLKKEMLLELMRDILQDKHDSLWIDTTADPDSDQRLRLNLWTPIRPRVD